MPLLVFQLPGVSSSGAGAAISARAPRPSQPRPLRQPPPARPAVGYFSNFRTRLSSLTFAPTVTATKTAALFTDADNDTLVSPGDTLKYTLAIGASGMDATGVNFSDTLDANLALVGGSVHASPLAFNDTYNWVGNTFLDTSARGLPSVTANDTAATDTFTLTTLTNAPTSQGGTVTLASNGHFTYTPPVGFTGTDTFSYTLTNSADASLTDTGTVTINLPVRVWYAQNATINGSGLSNSPFNSTASASTAASASTDIIYIFSDIGANPNLDGNFALDSGQQLLGQGVNLVANSITLFTAGAAPTTTDSSGNGITVASGNTIRGLIVGNCSGSGISGSGFGTLTVSDTTINNGLNQALSLSTGTLAATFASISSTNSATTGVNLNTVGGSLTSSSTTITNPSGAGLQVQSAPAGATLNFGNTTVNGSGSTGVVLGGPAVGNVGAVTFGALNIAPDASQRGLLAQENSGTVTSTSGAITTSGATSVEITRSSGTTPLVMALTSVSASSSAPNGIYLSNTSGSFTVNGDGTNTLLGGNNSGGTISNTVGSDGAIAGSGVYLNNAQNVTLRRMHLHDHPNFGLRGLSVNGFTLDYSTIDGANGTTSATFHEASLYFTELIGSGGMTGDIVSGGREDNVHLENTGGTLSAFTVSNCTIQNNSTSTDGNVGFHVMARTSANMTAAIQNCLLQGNRTDTINTDATDSSQLNITISGNTIVAGAGGNNQGNLGIDVTASASAQVTFLVDGNAIGTDDNFASKKPLLNTGINIFNGSAATANMTGKVSNNKVQNDDVTFGPGNSNGFGLRVFNSNQASMEINVTGNKVRGVQADFGLLAESSGAVAAPPAGRGALAVAVTNNDILVGSGALDDIRVQGRNFNSVCARISGNTTGTGGGGFFGIFVRRANSAVFNLEGGTANLATNNPGAGSTSSTGTINTVAANFCGSIPPSPPPEIEAAQAQAQTEARSPISEGSAEPQRQSRSLRATLGEAPKHDAMQKLTPAELSLFVQAAKDRWQPAGLTAEEIARLEALTFELADLPAGQLTLATANHILIDETAAGYGWFLDWSPQDDAEFEVPVPDKESQALESSPAFGKMDLLTVLMRGLGQALSQETLSTLSRRSAIMDGALGTGVRRVPTGSQVGVRKTAPRDQVLAIKSASNGAKLVAGAGQTATSGLFKPTPPRSSLPFAFSSPVGFMGSNLFRDEAAAPATTSSINAGQPRAMSASLVNDSVAVAIGTLPAGKSMTIVFLATINSPMPSGVCQVSNQGTVTGTNFSAVSTNTVTTPVATPPAITGATISRQQGTAASTSQIATVSDCNQAANTLTVTVNGGASATVNGVTVNSISVDGSGNVTASVVAGCTASNASFTLTVTDNTNKTATANLTVNVTANTPPTLGAYPNAGPVAVGTNLNVTPNAAPSDNGTVASVTASAPGFAGTFSGDATTGVITITNASPGGTYMVTVTATDNCGATTTTNFQLVVNSPPQITGATISRQQGSPASVSQIATVSDADQAANTLGVTVNGGASATVNGVTVNSISIDGAGQVTASVVASCSATNATFTLTVTDNQAATANASLIVNVTANTPPTLGNYPNTGPIPVGANTLVTPSAAPTDNGSVASVTASAPGFAGTFSGSAVTGVITITNASPGGVYTVTVTATDNCGATSTKNFQLTVNSPPQITGATITRQQGQPGTVSTIATVSDDQTPAGSLVVTATTIPAGITVASITNTNGTVTANVAASCAAALGNNTVVLTVTDGGGLMTNGNLIVNVTAGLCLRTFVAFSQDSTEVKANTTIFTGSVGANTSQPDPNGPPDNHEEVVIGQGVEMQQVGSSVVGDTVRLRNNAQVYNVYYNELLNTSGTILGSQFTPVTLPLLTLPALPTMTPGTQDITVGNSQTMTLGPGSYRNLLVNTKGTLILTGGIYHFASLDIRQEANLFFQGPSEFRVSTIMDTDAKSFIGPDVSAPTLQASQIIFYVGGTTADIGERNTVFANIYAPNGTVTLRANTQATGAFIGSQVVIGERVELTLKSAF